MLRESSSYPYRFAGTRQQLRTLLIQAPVAIVICSGPSLIVELINNKCLEMWSRTRDEVLNKPLFDIFPETRGKGFERIFETVYETGQTYAAKELAAEFIRHGKLSTGWFNSVFEPLHDKDGKITGIICVSTEVTEQVLARKIIEESERNFRIAIDQSPSAIAIIKVPEFSIEHVNKKWLGNMGAKLEELVGKSVFDVFPVLEEKGLDKILKAMSMSGQPHHEPEYRVDLGRFGRSGIAYFDVAYQPLTDANGIITRIMIISHEITEMVEARKKIEESEVHFRKLADDAPIMIWMAGTDKRCNFFNKGWLSFRGNSMEEETGNGWGKGVHPDDYDRCMEIYSSSFDVKKSFYMEYRLKRYDGVYRWVSDTGAPRYSTAGEFAGYIGSCTDVHEMRELEQRKDDFIRMANHELKTPVTSIKGYVQLLLTALKEEEEKTVSPLLIRSSLVSIDKQITRLTRLVSELLDLSRIETGTLELKTELFNLNELVIETVQDMLYTNSKHTINLFHDFACHVCGDKDRVGQVLINFLTNAIKYSPDSHKIEVWIQQMGKNEVSVNVKDYGIGIDKKFHEKIFERFYRAEGKKEQTYPGFGIGLFIAKEIVQRHNGSIYLTSEKGKGSFFTFTLPVAKKII
jgi:PAS domain S-box-containing protein